MIDRGRPGHAHDGVPASGPLLPSAFELAQAAVGNPGSAAALELFGSLEVRALGPRVISLDGAPPTQLNDGETLAVTPRPNVRVRYLAIAGGFDVPSILGGRGTLLVAGLGGFEGRILRRGDILRVGDVRGVPARASPSSAPVALEATIDVWLGPDRFDTEPLEELLTGAFRVSTMSDRTGMRLEGPPVQFPTALANRASAPMVPGAIQVTPRGLIVLGPDHPTTGGYPVIGVVDSARLGDLFARRPGAAVRFRACANEARRIVGAAPSI